MSVADFEDYVEDALLMDLADAEARAKLPQGAQAGLGRREALIELLLG